MHDSWAYLLDPSGSIPRGHPGRGSTGPVPLHGLPDALVFGSCLALGVVLGLLGRRRAGAPTGPVSRLSGASLLGCGPAPLGVVALGRPLPGLVGVVALAAGLASAAAVAALIRATRRGAATPGRPGGAAGARTRQLEVLVELGRRALAAGGPEALAEEVATLAARGLGVGLCGVFQALPGRPGLQLRAGVGWRDGLVGTAVAPAGLRPLAGFVARAAGAGADPGPGPDDPPDDDPLDPGLDAAGGLGIEVRGPGGPHGVLVAYATRPRPFVLAAYAPGRPFGDDEVWFLRSAAALFGSNLGRIEAERALVVQATTDALTGLHNARYLREESRAIEGRAARDGVALSAVMVDVDYFKGYNDSFGHPAGDEVLRELGAILRRQARAGDLVARYGGEEFALLLPGADADEARAFAERLRRQVAGHPWPLRPVTASLGVATGGPPSPGAEDLLARADRALYVAKRGGRDRVESAPAGDGAGEPAGPAASPDPAVAGGAGPSGPLALHVDDDPAYRRVLGRHLGRAGFRVIGAGSGAEGLTMASRGPDLILLDIRLPDGDGLEFCRRLKEDPATAAIPILSLSGSLHSGMDRARALAAGASAALGKSADPEELLAVASALVRAGRVGRDRGMSPREIAGRLREQAAEMARFCDATIEGWARMLDLRDHETEGHSRRVTELTTRVARLMGFDEAGLVHVRRGALLHDIGKVGIPDAILNKPGPLDEAEWRVMRRHPELARRMLEPIEILRPAMAIPCSHHERWDGAGYPEGLRGGEIPLAARIMAAADVHDALSHDRPYRGAWPAGRVTEHVRSLSGSHLDPEVADVFLRSLAGGDPQ